MVKTGLERELFERLNRAWLDRNDPVKLEKAHSNLAATLVRINKTKDIHLLIQSEQIILINELERYANSPEMVSSLRAGLEGLEAGKQALSIVQDSKSYQIVARAMATKNKSGGLPLDAFRVFIRSHQVRLGNLLKSGIAVFEKTTLRQQKSNLDVAKKVYMDMQRKALGLSEQGKDKGR